jgi:protein-S-isoprenylcysteine O-methyltransferase Ste14
MRLERQLGQTEGNLKSATRNRIVGGVILLIGMFALIQFNVAVGVVVLVIGGWVLVRAMRTMDRSHRSIESLGSRVTDASDTLADLTAQPPDAE